MTATELALCARFEAVTGLPLSSANPVALPPSVLDAAAPVAAALLARGGFSRRTMNALQRAVDELGPVSCSYRRLMRIRGFGLAALIEVLESQRPNPDAGEDLEGELDRLLAVRKRPLVPTPSPLLDRALEVIAGAVPASEEEIAARLASAGLVSGPVDLRRIERAARFHPQAEAFAVIRRPGLVVAVPRALARTALTLHRLALRAMTTFGLANLRDLCARLPTGTEELFSRILRAHAQFRWLDEGRGWFWFSAQASRLMRVIARLVSAGGALDLGHLRGMLERRWPPSLVPPLPVLVQMCRFEPALVVEGFVVRPLHARRPSSSASARDRAGAGVRLEGTEAG